MLNFEEGITFGFETFFLPPYQLECSVCSRSTTYVLHMQGQNEVLRLCLFYRTYHCELCILDFWMAWSFLKSYEVIYSPLLMTNGDEVRLKDWKVYSISSTRPLTSFQQSRSVLSTRSNIQYGSAQAWALLRSARQRWTHSVKHLWECTAEETRSNNFCCGKQISSGTRIEGFIRFPCWKKYLQRWKNLLCIT